jgi:hypothetical protein
MKCKTCKFWDETNGSLGACHRYAPRPIIKEGTENRISVFPLWPKTKAQQWCGEWSVRVEVEPQD